MEMHGILFYNSYDTRCLLLPYCHNSFPLNKFKISNSAGRIYYNINDDTLCWYV
jgi:hypothetical protein